jgi:hypothetical protein
MSEDVKFKSSEPPSCQKETAVPESQIESDSLDSPKSKLLLKSLINGQFSTQIENEDESLLEPSYKEKW